MKVFVTNGACIPSIHYMVDLSERLEKMKKMVDKGDYFVINRARQYGKTTTMNALREYLKYEYEVVSISFEGISRGGFEDETSFVKAFCRKIKKELEAGLQITKKMQDQLDSFLSINNGKIILDELFYALHDWCKENKKPIVLMIDEVDRATNNEVFLDFLGQLREGYLNRTTKQLPAFQSVILAGVTDVKHLKRKIRADEDSQENSPWNIATAFNIDMSLSENGIKGMLEDYESDHRVGMDTKKIAKLIRDYTSGYPFLVSRICQLIDEEMVPEVYQSLSEAWTSDGVEQAVKTIIKEKNALFDSLMGKVRDYDKLREQLEYMMFRGETIDYMADNKEQQELMMYGLIVERDNTVVVANKIFEMRLLKYFVGESKYAMEMKREATKDKPEFIKGGELNIPLIMERFIVSQKLIRDWKDEAAEERFIEEEGRERFITYLSPIINGIGTYSVEDQMPDERRMDLVVHYNGRRYIIEMKIWHGDRYNKKGEAQIMGYLDHYGLSTGYMLSFSFNKNKEPGVKEVHIGGKILYEGIV